jgi:HD-GYP domain-containing protein (c-di-GMP phosphodiesterase class II)
MDETPAVIFCEAACAEGGGTLKTLFCSCAGSSFRIVLIISPHIKTGLLRALKPWGHDYLCSPVLRQAAAARIRNVLHLRELEAASSSSFGHLDRWLAGMESATRFFQPLSFERERSHRDLAERVLRPDAEDSDRPKQLLIAEPNGKETLLGDLYSAGRAGSVTAHPAFAMPEAALFLNIRAANEPFARNHSDRGERLGNFQRNFPPELLSITGTIRNVAGLVDGSRYVIGLNYGRRVTAMDALHLKGLSLPMRFLAAVADNVRDVSASFLVMARALAVAADSCNDSGAHVWRMNQYARLLAEEMRLPDRLRESISYSAQLHDVGKIYIHPDLLEKPLKLTPREFDIVKKHPVLGANILGEAPLLDVARNIALTHHECWDGSGYPAGLSGDAIPVEGAITKIADVYDALRTMQTYKKSCSHEDACRMILEGTGEGHPCIRPSHFHPDILRAFKNIHDKFAAIHSTA